MNISELSFSYNKNQIFDKFSFFDVSPLILLMGPSGCGKTTLLKIISGYLNENVSYKELSYIGNPYLILQGDALCPWLSGYGNIQEFMNMTQNNLEDIPLYKHTLKFLDKKICNLSFGQRRMVELLRAIIFKPQLLLLDEPFNFLDSESRKFVSDSLQNLIDKYSTKIILTSHYDEDLGNLKPVIYYFPKIIPVIELNKEK
jgi:ABC-type multidrug transport system ATPase subunit